MSIFRTIAMFLYLFGYMIVHYGTLRRGERALAAGDTETVEQLVDRHIPRWSRGILKVTGVTPDRGRAGEHPQGRPLRVRGQPPQLLRHPPCCWPASTSPTASWPRKSWEKIPLLNRWMKLLGCVFVQRDDLRASVRALNDATAIVESGRSFVIFPEGTRYKGRRGRCRRVQERRIPHCGQDRCPGGSGGHNRCPCPV